jgi:hypothetical protein
MFTDGESALVNLFFKGLVHGCFHEITENSRRNQNDGNDNTDNFTLEIQVQIHAGSCRVFMPGSVTGARGV